jgi:hypothetical protein
MKIIDLSDQDGILSRYGFYCPGCKCHHWFATKDMNNTFPKWEWNGDREKPTISPSILVHYSNLKNAIVCHSFIKDGQIQFLGDCTHELAGKTIPMEDADWPAKEPLPDNNQQFKEAPYEHIN